MKRGQTLILAMLLILLASAVQGMMDSGEITVDIEVESGISIERGAGSVLEYLVANLSFVPKQTDYQEVLRVEADPKPEFVGDVIGYRWDEPVPDDILFRFNTRVQRRNVLPNVKKAKFPVKLVGMDEYIQASETIDSGDPKIVRLAGEIAAGESDLYSVVFKTAEWTRENIQYNLSTLTAKASQKASWVLRERRGVCDEITTLFIALLRSVGVPAKFVSGVAYTESPLFPDNWGGHGWAEVYFPGTGWVPFDVTYAQYGWVDPSHLKFQEDIDSGASSLKFLWLGKDIDVVTKQIKVDADLVSEKGKMQSFVDLELDILQDTVGIGSYNLVEATIRNKLDSYVTAFVYLAHINELEVEEGQMKPVWLKPREAKKVYWLVQVIEGLDRNYVYTFPMTIGDVFNNTADQSFDVNPDATVFSKADILEVRNALEKEEEKVFSKEIEIYCEQEKEAYYVYDTVKIGCSARNIGNFPFDKLSFCFEDCKEKGLGIAQEEEFEYLFKPTAGVNKVKFSVTGKDVAKTEFYDVEVWDEPKLSVVNYSYPREIEFQKGYVYEFMLKKESASPIFNATLVLDAAGIEKELGIGQMDGDKKFLFNMDSGDLGLDGNEIVVRVVYFDKNGKMYTIRDVKKIDLVNVTFGQKMIIFLKQLDRKIRNLFK
ncbi:transglutaminase family protein [Nanoarchaeota archaeon]